MSHPTLIAYLFFVFTPLANYLYVGQACEVPEGGSLTVIDTIILGRLSSFGDAHLHSAVWLETTSEAHLS